MCGAAALGRDADLRQGDAQALEFPDESFDTVLCALGLCAIPDDRRAVTEMARVLRPGGRLLLVDHVAASAPVLRGVQWLYERISVPLAGEYFRRMAKMSALHVPYKGSGQAEIDLVDVAAPQRLAEAVGA